MLDVGLPPIRLAHTIHRLEQFRELYSRVVRGDLRRAVPEQVLPVLEAHARCAQAPSKGVLQVMDTHFGRPTPARARFHALFRIRAIGLPL